MNQQFYSTKFDSPSLSNQNNCQIHPLSRHLKKNSLNLAAFSESQIKKTKQNKGLQTKINKKNLQLQTKNNKGVSEHHESFKSCVQNFKQKTHSTIGKIVSKKLFQKAKILNNRNKKGLHSKVSKQLQENSAQHSSNLKKVQLCQKKKQNFCDSRKKNKDLQDLKDNQKSQEIQITIRSQQKKSKEKELKFEIDQEQNKMIEENNLFRSRCGQQFLSSLNNKFLYISSIKRRNSNENSFRHSKHSNKQYSNPARTLNIQIQKVNSEQSYSFDEEDSFVTKNQQKSVLKVDSHLNKNQQEQQQMSNFSKLIIEDDYNF